MIRSMTGYGRARFEAQGAAFEVEARSINHRYLDLRARLPRLFSAFEADVRAAVQERFARGKVDVNVASQAGAGPAQQLDVDLDLAEGYVRAAGRLAQRCGLAAQPDVTLVLSLPGVARLRELELPEDTLRDAFLPALAAALDAADAMRCAEGRALERDLTARLDRVQELADELETRAGRVVRSVRERLRKRAEQLRDETGLLDEARLHQEIVIAADRLDVTEEIVRLRSHVDQFRQVLAGAERGRPVGRRLDFLLQELAREANTVGSKGSDASVAHRVVELKTELERMREQVQNLE